MPIKTALTPTQFQTIWRVLQVAGDRHLGNTFIGDGWNHRMYTAQANEVAREVEKMFANARHLREAGKKGVAMKKEREEKREVERMKRAAKGRRKR